ncbi:O-methyltransferase [Anaerovorax odorimutans]|uniref:O-methyltransferase n=1 Tax=Anaerovorax odorimutans TaxID=109327 RepID=UPI00040BA671|nr:O-methyltransferase [Anaerovorax odorimutans]
MYITIPQVTEYLNGLYKPLNEDLRILREYAEDKHIPIILKDAEELILNYIRLKKPKRILEVGTAIGYSALCFATVDSNVQVTTLEIKEDMYKSAKENIKKFNFEDRIDVIFGDAKMSLTELFSDYEKGKIQPYDMVFIDAAKGQYKVFWDECIKMLNNEAVIISDNVLYKAITASEEFLSTRRNGTIMRRMRAFLTHITNLDNVTTAVLPVGDGLAISQFK